MFLKCLDCKLSLADVVFRQRGKGFEKPNTTPRCDACIHKKRLVHKDDSKLACTESAPMRVRDEFELNEAAAILVMFSRQACRRYY